MTKSVENMASLWILPVTCVVVVKTNKQTKLLVLLGTAGTTGSYPWLWCCGPLGPLSAKWYQWFLICYLGLS